MAADETPQTDPDKELSAAEGETSEQNDPTIQMSSLSLHGSMEPHPEHESAAERDDQTLVELAPDRDDSEEVRSPASPTATDKTLSMDASTEGECPSDADGPTVMDSSLGLDSETQISDSEPREKEQEAETLVENTEERAELGGADEGSDAVQETEATAIGYVDPSTDLDDRTLTAHQSSFAEPFDKTLAQDSDGGSTTRTAPIDEEDTRPAARRPYPSLGRFEILDLLGEGAFGAVYLAHDPHLDRKVAIKVAKTGVLVGKQDIDRFMREARAAAQLRHPNIVPVYEVGQLPTTNFIAYEYIKGRTLGDLLKEKKTLPVEQAVRYMQKIASGLDYAHQHGIVHRDMKPDNILLDAEDEPHIADFGLARRDEGEATRTREGMFMGTPSYMSPEQASGKAHLADARSDVWSLGVMLQEMLTGVRPFRGNVTEVLVAVQNHEPPSLRSIDHSLPADLETIVEKCLTKNVQERYQSARTLSEELERFQHGEPILARPLTVFGRTWRWMKRRPDIASLLGVIAVVLITGAGLSLAFGISASRSEQRAHEQAVTRAESQLTSIRTADAASLPVLISALGPYREDLRAQLMSLVGSDETDEIEQSRLRLAATTLYVDEPGHSELVEQSAKDLLDAPPEELVIRVRLLQPFRELVEVPLWNTVTYGGVPQRERFTALAALAAIRSSLPDWPSVTSDMVAEMLAMNPLELSAWLPAVASIRDELEPALTDSFTNGDDANEQYRAAIVLGELFRDTPETLLALVPKAQPEQLGPLLEALKPRADFFAERLQDRLTDVLTRNRGSALTDEQANEALNYALALLGLGRGDPVWPLLGDAPNQHLRTSLIHEIAPATVPWRDVATRMQWEQDPAVIAALCMTLGEYGSGDLLPNDRERLTPGLLQLFREHPHPGVHSATEWVLRQWGLGSEVDDTLVLLKSRERPTDRGWHVTEQGHTLAIVPPTTFAMGSPESEPGRHAEEQQHLRLIPRTYGISLSEVTVAEYMEFDPDYKIGIARRFAPDDDCPVINIKWYDAVAYCRWLSEKEGFEDHEMCYPPLEELDVLRTRFGAKSLELPDDLLDRPAYRLPTAAEWECAARAGTVTSRPFGNPATYARNYAWYRDNSQDRTWPTRLLKPNNLGLFDIQGNALEWCHNYFFESPPPPGPDGIVIDGTDSRDGFNRECRGGSNRYPIESLRIAYADPIPPGNIDTDFGFRIARTYPTGPSSASTEE